MAPVVQLHIGDEALWTPAVQLPPAAARCSLPPSSPLLLLLLLPESWSQELAEAQQRTAGQRRLASPAAEKERRGGNGLPRRRGIPCFRIRAAGAVVWIGRTRTTASATEIYSLVDRDISM